VRNRLLAGLTGGLLVVEAGVRSGTRVAAAAAAAIRRPPRHFPDQLGSSQSWGCHQLIRDGAATLVTSATDALATLEPTTALFG
jgi:DNA processing protein